jgi:hypothetical protein
MASCLNRNGHATEIGHGTQVALQSPRMFRVLLGLVVALSFAAARTPAVSDGDPRPTGEVRRTSTPNLDVYGNQVERAVGGYRADPLGELYEEHSPDTAVLKLGPPSS